MLKLVDIKKDYPTSSFTVRALKGVSIDFRKSEFVSILGPSGCGKTTMLNIIGGLDKYTSGDLMIGGISTKGFKDSDWDVYRNHRVGFIFQSYNLIPHQTVLANVELALTIAGVDKVTRKEKARAALEKVGLGDQCHKKPNQLSGGQCQRVAIARALINDPEILLADEPTGALDTKTSVQIMELIRQISKERLVIMVTHNQELAAAYSTRVIKLLDGLLVDDSNPVTEFELNKAKADQIAANQALLSGDNNQFDQLNNTKKQGDKTKDQSQKQKAKMSFFTAFKLSLSNLFSKRTRSIVMAVASAIGIIGVSLVLAISSGVQGFISDMQNDMLAGNPIQINQTGFDMEAIANFMGPQESAQVWQRGDYVNVEAMIAELYTMIDEMDDIFVQNRIDRNYIQFLLDMDEQFYSAMHFNYGLNISYSFFTQWGNDFVSLSAILSMYAGLLESVEGFADFSSLLGMIGNPVRQAPRFESQTATDYLLTQFEVVAKRDDHIDGIAREKNEIMIVLGQDNVLTDIMLGQIGFYSQDEFLNIVYKIAEPDRFDPDLHDNGRIEFDDMLNQKFFWQPNDNIFSENNSFVDMMALAGVGDPDSIPFQYNPIMDSAWQNGIELEIVGILSPRQDVSFVMMDAGVFYTPQLAEHIIDTNWDSALIDYMRSSHVETLTGAAMIDDELELPPIFAHLTPVLVMPLVENPRVIPYNYSFTIDGVTTTRTSFVGTNSGGLLSLLGFGGGAATGGALIGNVGMRSFGGNVYSTITRDEDTNEILSWVVNLREENGQMRAFALPNSISIFSSSFDQVNSVTTYLRMWNNRNAQGRPERFDITLSDGTFLEWDQRERVLYTDMLSLIMSMVETLIQIITITLTSFTALSLVVSSFMIGILTYVSVMERIKEIGVIRSLGGRKRDVANLFTAETFILGFASGVVGIIITYLLSLFINIIVGVLTGVWTIAALPWWQAIIMVVVSVGLTMIAGVLPSGSAARKDPVVALRSE
ncbi:MAG: ABC transporter ATP-binding protein/permease [Firmicutes bacterium]|nr:ABC transporter ATP-binding protein/permease [Bacillota bacterium]